MKRTSDAAPTSAEFDEFVHRVANDWRACTLRSDVVRLLEYAETVTQTPAACQRGDVDHLRAGGWSDAAIHDAVQVVAYFNYINRIADALGVEQETDLPNWGGDDGATRQPENP